jgi:pseudouridine synthase
MSEIPPSTIRLQKAISDAGVASRRRAEELIAGRRVTVDGVVVTEQGVQVDPTTQKITVDGKALPVQGKRRYVALHKPPGYVCTMSDRHAKLKVTDLVTMPGVTLKPAGRLDADSEGLILLSDDGDFIYKVTHPSMSLGKTYHVTVEGSPESDTLNRLARGLTLEGETRRTAKAQVTKLGKSSKGYTRLEMVIHEGRKRQIRRMLDTVGHPVVRLIRVQVGPVLLGILTPGQWRELTRWEIEAIMAYNGPDVAVTEEGSKPSETSHRSRPRPGPGKDQRKSAQERVQVYKDRINGGLPSGGEHNVVDWGRRQGRGKSSGPDQRG